MTAWIVETVVSKSSTNWLIETFMTDWSRTMTNCAVANATSGNQRFMGPLLSCRPAPDGRHTATVSRAAAP